MFVVVGATGRTGSVVANALLDRKDPVRVVVRSVMKGEPWRARGAQVAVADLEDARGLTAAFKGASAAYLMLPPPALGETKILEKRRLWVDTLAKAATAASLPYAVVLSSIGAEQAEGTGIIGSLQYAEKRFRKLGLAVSFLRAAYFLENWGSSLESVRTAGVLPSFLLPERRIPMVAARDVGAIAAQQMLNRPASRRIVNLAGPQEYSPDEIALAFGGALGKTVRVEAASAHVMGEVLANMGASPELGRLYQEMVVGINAGHVRWDPEGALVRGVTTADEVAAQLLKSP